jgi:tetratricopeptide (TPR) repeat protein
MSDESIFRNSYENYEKGKYDDALKELNKINNKDYNYYLLKSKIYFEINDYCNSLKSSLECLNYTKFSPEPYQIASKCYLNMFDYEKAKNMINKAEEVDKGIKENIEIMKEIENIINENKEKLKNKINIIEKKDDNSENRIKNLIDWYQDQINILIKYKNNSIDIIENMKKMNNDEIIKLKKKIKIYQNNSDNIILYVLNYLKVYEKSMFINEFKKKYYNTNYISDLNILNCEKENIVMKSI